MKIIGTISKHARLRKADITAIASQASSKVYSSIYGKKENVTTRGFYNICSTYHGHSDSCRESDFDAAFKNEKQNDDLEVYSSMNDST